MQPRPTRKSGFSLVELIVVIAVIAAIIAIIVPSITNFSDAANDASKDRNLQQARSMYQNYKAAGGTEAAADVAAAAAGTAGWSGTVSLNGKAIDFKIPYISNAAATEISAFIQ